MTPIAKPTVTTDKDRIVLKLGPLEFRLTPDEAAQLEDQLQDARYETYGYADPTGEPDETWAGQEQR